MKRTLIIMALLAAAAVGTAVVYQNAARERDYREFLARGDAARGNGESFTAIELYSGAIALRPDSMLAHLRRGETYQRHGELEAAARDFRTAATLDPSAPRALEQWADVLYEQERYRRAAEVYEARIRLDDRSAAVRYHLGLAYYRDGRFDEAVATLERAAALDSRLAEAWYLMGICFRESNRIDDAIAMQEKAVAQSPGLVPAREELADLYGARGRYEDEIGQLQMLAGLDAGRIERRIAVGVAHARAGHIDLAILTLANALEPATDPAPVYAALGRVWLDEATRHNRPDALARALEALERAASASTATSETKTLYGKALRRARQLDAAERVLQQATERFPVDASAFAEYAAVAEQQQHFETARSALLTYASLAPDDENLPSHALTIGTLSLRLNDPATAVIWLERAVAARPGDVRPLAPLVEAQLRSGNRDAARQAASRGLQIDPANVRLRALLRQLS